jgi:integrase
LRTTIDVRQIPLGESAMTLLRDWKSRVRESGQDSLMFATRSGKPISPNNVLRRGIFPACQELGLPKLSWLAFRRTFASWTYDRGIPAKVIAKLMEHEKVDMNMNIYAQAMEESVRNATTNLGSSLFQIVHSRKTRIA